MKELTQGSPIKLIIFFTIPLLIGNVFQQLYATVDMIIVGQTLGTNALAAVGATGSINFLLVGFAVGLTSGLSIVTAQRFGARDEKGVKTSFATSILLSGIVTIVLTILSILLVRPMLELMQTPAQIIDQSQQFITVILAGIFCTVSFNLLSNVIRALGDAKTPLVFLIIATLINIGLDFFFILFLNMGVAGAGLATILAQLIASILCLIYIYRKIPLLQISKKDFAFITKEDLKTHARLAFPMAFQSSIIAIGAIVLQIAINTLGTDAVAANTAASRIDQFAILPTMSFGVTMATFAAQNLGAKKYDRIIKAIKQGLMLSISFSIFIGAIVIIFGQVLARMFVSASEFRVLELVQTYFNINASMYWVLAILFILRFTLQGLGQAAVPTIAGVMELIMRVVAAIFLTQLFGYSGAVSANPLAWIGSVSVLAYSSIKAMKQLRKLELKQKEVGEIG